MSELHHLQLFGNKLTNDGLQSILDGCPHLESLYLRQCFNVTLAGNLGRRCAEQIKDLRRPHDSTDFDAEVLCYAPFPVWLFPNVVSSLKLEKGLTKLTL
jgi:hypothetical protein